MKLEPPTDAVFQYLLSEAAVTGRVPVWGIVVAPARVVAFDPTLRLEHDGDGPAIVAAIGREWNEGRPVQPWVYPRGDLFVAPDDYFALAAIRRGRPDLIACQCLGEPSSRLVHERVGPLALADVRRMLGVRIAQ